VTALALVTPWAGAQTTDPTIPAASATEGSLTEQARELLAAGRTAQALITARRAVTQDPSDYKAHYYLAYALMEAGETDAALRSVAQADALAGSSEAKAAVEALRNTISARDGLKEAQTALADGLHAKAARLYLAIWQRGGLPADQTIATAELLQKQGDFANAVAVLRNTTTRHLGTPAAEAAAKQLLALEPELLKLAHKAIAEAELRDPQDPERARWLRSALEHQPDLTTVRLMLANDAAENADWPGLQAQLRDLQRRKQLEPLLNERKLALGRWQQHTELRQLLADIWGEQRALALLQSNSDAAGPVSPARAQAKRQAALAPALEQLRQAGVVPGNGVAFRDCDVCPELVWLPAGQLPRMDATNNPVAAWHNNLRFDAPFAVGKFEVTFAQWDACAAAGACAADIPEGKTPGTFFDTAWGRGQQPVVNISLRDARAYARWLSQRTGHSYRVLTRAEFSYAAQAGEANPASAHIGNCGGCSRPDETQTLPVGSFPANPWGLHDLVGNTHELVEGCHGDGQQAARWPKDGSPITEGCVHTDDGGPNGRRISALGGSWDRKRPSEPFVFGLAYTHENARHHNHGFRVTRSLLPR
jgi:formylglycine-generating enzyme required for sulfatase activity